MSGRWEAVSHNVKLLHSMTPAHRLIACVGVFALGCLTAGCEKGPSIGGRKNDRSLELTSDTIQLPAGVNLLDVSVKSGQNTDFNPAQVSARIGDVLRFTVADTRTHALVVTAPGADAKATLESTGQLRSPPLVAKGQAWVLSLKGIPAGVYTIACISHAGTVTVVIQ